MSNRFNLLSLHGQEDRHPRTWICLSGTGLGRTMQDLEKLVLTKHNLTRESFSRNLSMKYNCSIGVIKRILQGHSKYFPIPLIIELLDKSGRKDFYSKLINEQVELLKVNSASSKPVRAVKILTPTLAKILGAFMADGSLTTAHYNIELTEEYRDSIMAFARWIKEIFGVDPTHLYKKKNCCRVIYPNKIMVRYLTAFFEVFPGRKTYTAHEPSCIRESKLKMRKSFALGVLMFDGCVTKSGKMILCVKSEKLHQCIKDIWSIDNIFFGTSKSKRGEWNIFTTENNKKVKFFQYFEVGTQKHKLLQWIGGMNSKPILKEGNFSYTRVLRAIEKAGSCDMKFLEKTFNRSYTTIRHYLNILEAQNRIIVSREPRFISEGVSPETSIILSKSAHNLIFKVIRRQFGKDKNFYEILQIIKGTFSSWRKRKNGIPIRHLLEMSQLLKINFETISKSPFHVDRDIMEII